MSEEMKSAKEQMEEVILEKIAELEHKQWMSWVNYLIKEYPDLPLRLVKKWEMNLYPYKYLKEDVKEKDRLWARKVVEVFNSFGNWDKQKVKG